MAHQRIIIKKTGILVRCLFGSQDFHRLRARVKLVNKFVDKRKTGKNYCLNRDE